MHWELWDTDSGNLVEEFDTEAQALQGVRDLLAVNRPDYIDFLVLGAMYDEGEPQDVELPPVLAGTELQSRLTELAQEAAADTARTVHARVRKWIAEEGWDVREIPNRHAILSISVTLQDGRGVRILQHKAHVDHVTIARNLSLGEAIQREFLQIPEDEQQEVLLTIQRDATMVGVDLEGLELPINTVWHVAYAYFDGLTKDVLIQRILLVLRVHALSVNTLVCALEKAKRSDAAENLRRRDPRDRPGVSDLLTVAS